MAVNSVSKIIRRIPPGKAIERREKKINSS
jgi:hypothetical protein